MGAIDFALFMTTDNEPNVNQYCDRWNLRDIYSLSFIVYTPRRVKCAGGLLYF